MTRALIFDFDGLVVDTESPVYESWSELYAAHGHELTLEQYVRCVGSTEHQFDPLGHLSDLVSDAAFDPEAAHREHRAKVRATLAGRDTLPGVRERLAEARAHGISLAIASSSPSEWIDPWLERLGLTDHFQVVRTRDHVSEAKPSPELFLTAAEQLSVQPHQAVVFEDSHNGLRAAVAAQMPCVAVPNVITERSDFSAAALVLSSLAEMPLERILHHVHGTA